MFHVGVDVVDAVGLQEGGNGEGGGPRRRIRKQRQLGRGREARVGHLRRRLRSDEGTVDICLEAKGHDSAARVRVDAKQLRVDE